MILLEFLRGSTLHDMLAIRASMRRQRDRLAAALRDLRAEVRSWNQHRMAQKSAGQPVPGELARLWDDLAAREIELADCLADAETALAEVGARIGSKLATRRRAG